jgi:hypothetical protein
MSNDLAKITEAREALARSAQAMLAGDISYVQGARHICGMLDEARVDPFAEPFVTFVGVSSETDTVPFGWMRENWHPETRAENETEWQMAEEWAERSLEGACRDVIAWVSGQPSFGN